MSVIANLIIIIIISALHLTVAPSICAPPVQAPPAKPQPAVARKSPVMLDGKELFSVQGIGSFSPVERANSITARIKKIAEDLTIPTDSIKTDDEQVFTDIVTGDIIILSVTDKDAVGTGHTREDLAREYAEKIRSCRRLPGRSSGAEGSAA